MSSSAQRDLYEHGIEAEHGLGATGTDGAATLRRLAVERLAAHRSKRPALEQTPVAEPRTTHPVSEAARRAREAVVARYSASPSYREALGEVPIAAAPQAAVSQAVVAQAIAQPVETPAPRWMDEPVRVAQPVATAEAAFVEPMIAPNATAEAFCAEPVAFEPVAAAAVASDDEEDFAWLDAKSSPVAAASFALPETEAPTVPVGEWQVRPFEELPSHEAPPRYRDDATHEETLRQETAFEEIAGLEEEIAFRLAPEFQDHLIEPLPIQANIIEFPRQLVAARKARPRLAEGPLRDDEVVEQNEPLMPVEPEFQMRIFEVEPLPPMPAPQVDTAVQPHPETRVAESEAPPELEWQHLVLDAAEEEDEAPSWQPLAEPVMPSALVHDSAEALPVASFELRLMSATVDAICVGVAFVAFAAVAGWTGGHELRALPLRTMGMIGVALLAGLAVFYQALFLTFSRSTPGMYYANLVFRTLAGREPSRRLMRRRVGANVLAAMPLGLGLVWSLVDKRGLGWNDRISGIFLREY